MLTASIIILALLFIAARKFNVHIRTPQNFDIHFDEKFSAIAKQEIATFIKSFDLHCALDVAKFVSTIKERFPFIQSIQTRLVPPRIMKLTCDAKQPLCMVNQTLVLVPSGTLCPTTYFQESLGPTLPTIAIDQSQLQTYNLAIMVSAVKTLNDDIFAQYNVTLSSEGNIVFEDKNQPRLSLLCRLDHIPSQNICMYGNYLRDLLENRSAFKGKSKTHIVADLRFEKQIILSKK